MPYSNPITQQELGELTLYNPLHPRDGSPNEIYMPKAYFLIPPATQDGPVKWRLFDAAYISTGIIDPNRLGTGAVGDGNLYLADDGTWKPVSGGAAGNLDDVTTIGNVTDNPITVGGVTTPYVLFDTTATPTLQVGMMRWNDFDGVPEVRLKGNNVTGQLFQENLVRVVNKTGADLFESEYKVVRVRVASEGGAQGQRLAVVLAQGNNDPDSVTTLGVVTENIGDNQEGFITVFGNVSGINTTGSLQGETWVDGDVLYLSPTIPGRLTKVKPSAPNHTVTVGYVVYAHSNQGKIFVKVDNGYELEELHNVLITSGTVGQLLRYNGTVWENWTPNFLTTAPTLDQVTTAGNTTTNTISVGKLLVNTVIDAGFSIDVNGTARVQGQLTVLNSNLVIPVNEGWTLGGEILLTRPGAARTAVRIGRSSGGSGDDGEIELFRDGVSLFRFSGTADNYINPTGLGSKLGIGTTTPAYRVDVQGTTLVDSTVSVQGAFNINPLAAPPSIAGYTLSAGTSLGVGRYYYFVTYVTAIGETNAGSNLIVDTTTGNTTVNLTGIPVSSDPRVTARKIYRTKVGGTSDNHWFLTTISNNTTTTYTDSIADTSLPGVGAQFYKVNTTARYFTVSGVQGMLIDQNLTAFGRNAGSAIITNSAPAVRTVLIGAQAGEKITTGQGNVIVGVAGVNVTTGGSNSLFGDLAGYAINTGYSNTIVGSQSGRFLTVGYRNTMIGNDTGRYLTNGTTQFTSGTDNTILGGNIRMFAVNDANSIVIGYDARGLGSNTTVIGNSSILFTAIPAGNMTIGGTVNAGFKLDVQGTIRSTDVITASGGTSTDWNTAFSWGNHASAGYVTTGTAQTITGLKSFARTLNIVRTIAATDDVNTVLNQNTLVSSGFILNGATNAPVSGNLQYVNIGAYTLASLDNNSTSIYIRKLYSPTNFTAWERIYVDSFHPLADQLTTARQINGTSFNGTADITTANWGTARTITIGGTGKSVNGSGNVSWNIDEIQAEYKLPNNTGRGTLSDPTIRDIALSHSTMSNKIRFIAPTSQEESADGTTWVPSTRATADQLGDLVRGEGEGTNFVMIPGGTIGTYGGYRITWDATGPIGYVFFNHLYMFLETRSNPVNILLERYHNTTGWEVLTGPHVANNWPGHYTIAHTSTPYSGSATQYSRIRITFSSTRTNTNDMVLNAVEWYGTYPNQKRNVESYDRNRNATFPAGLRANNLLLNTSVSSGYTLDVNGTSRITSSVLGISTSGLLVTAVSGDTRNVSLFLGNTGDYNPAANTNTVNSSIAGIRLDWYSENWRISATRGSSTDIKGLLFSRNGVERMVIDTNGYVGINRTTPSAPLDIQMTTSSEGIIVRRIATPTQYLAIHEGDGSAHVFEGIGDKEMRIWNKATTYGIKFYTNTTPKLTISSAGDVGIGTETPTTKLDVSGVITATGGNSTNWNTAYGWGNHAGLYSLVSHTHTFASITSKPTTLSGYGITDAATALQGTNADTAFGWGNHASAGYAMAFTGFTGDIEVAAPIGTPGITKYQLQISNGIITNVVPMG